MQLVLNGILFCIILLLCVIFLIIGYYLGIKKRTKSEVAPLTEEQQRKMEKEKREMENFWNYNGTEQ